MITITILYGDAKHAINISGVYTRDSFLQDIQLLKTKYSSLNELISKLEDIRNMREMREMRDSRDSPISFETSDSISFLSFLNLNIDLSNLDLETSISILFDLNENYCMYNATKIDLYEIIKGYNPISDEWHCVTCGVSMGKNNPRQLCCKTYCENTTDF